ncbi:DUF58 domain-containing protein [Nitrospirillum viridazoti]|uniref:MxaS protein n=1 Tax=Nitrospirillum viridazoti CBAmc TaxID=1441467 RepID=A0A248K238_9PROT|nr:DUF58 domain-containing protein [Nitrospirillum amazonense]ASG24849.1 MxaS protein [Nitrospirillum amazonense CBAmc]TWB33342.1 hypothetical protein FBZ91_11455 [Nitrospirillum amazonense]
MSPDVPDIHYRPRGAIASWRAGAHPSRQVGALGAFRDLVPFATYPDARRIDVRATALDPFETTMVRRFRQRAAIDVYALVDLSASLRYQGQAAKAALVRDLCVVLARSATRTGDRFGLIGCDAGMRQECFLPATARRAVSTDVAERLDPSRWAAAGMVKGGMQPGAEGLAQAAPYLAGARKMAFLISDFLLPMDLLRRVFEGLAMHDIVPVVVRDSTEEEELPDWGLLDLADLESARRRLVFMRPGLKRRWREAERARQAAIRQLAARYGRTPVTVIDRLDIDRFSRDLMEA